MSHSKLLTHVGDIVAAHMASHAVPAQDVPQLIEAVYSGLSSLNNPDATTNEIITATPAMTIRSSVRSDSIGCLECGKRFKSLRKHILGHGFTPDQYRAKWSLPTSYSMVSAEYSTRRSEMAKSSGFGRANIKV